MTLMEMTMASVITLGTVASATISVDAPALTRRAETAAAQATCRAVDTAILAFYTDRQVLPTTQRDVQPYVKGDISRYRIIAGRAAGPGCDELRRR